MHDYMIDVSHSGISASNTDNSALWGIFNQAAQTGEATAQAMQ
jgi:hypothetical protein